MTRQPLNRVPGAVPGRRAMPLTVAEKGQEVTLVEVRGGSGLTHRLAEMGLTPGVRMRIVSCGRPGPYIVSVKGARLMLGRGMVDRVFVFPTAC